jgi:NAD(P)H-dependent FMN reductase
MSGAMKNMIDWVSRPSPKGGDLACFKGKAAALMSASPGGLGGLRGLVHVRAMLGNIGVLVLPEQVAVPRAMEAFTPEGALVDSKRQAAVESLGRRLCELLVKFHS